jgi:hypothetical protein
MPSHSMSIRAALATNTAAADLRCTHRSRIRVREVTNV